MSENVGARASGVEVIDDLVYASHDGRDLLSTLYRPEGPGPHPIIVGVGGGGWRRSSRHDHRQWGLHLARQGYALLTIEYRANPGPEPTFPQAVHDVIAAVQFAKGKAADFGLDVERIGLLGSSAGAHLSALVALAYDHPAFRGAYPDDPFTDLDANVNALIGVYGTYDLFALWQDQLRNNEPPGQGICRGFLGKELFDDQSLYSLASPIRHIHFDKAKGLAVFLPYGTEDTLVPPHLQSEPFATALTQAGATVHTCAVPDAGHLWFSIEPIDEANSASAFLAPRLLRFLAMSPITVRQLVTDLSTRPR